MSVLGQIARAYAVDRILRGSRRPRRRGYSRRSRGRTGFYGPFPYHSRRTRGGSRVTVSGCCLPIPLGMLAALAGAVRLAARR